MRMVMRNLLGRSWMRSRSLVEPALTAWCLPGRPFNYPPLEIASGLCVCAAVIPVGVRQLRAPDVTVPIGASPSAGRHPCSWRRRVRI